MPFVCHVTLQGHMIRASYIFIVRSLSRYITMLARLKAIGAVIVEI